MTSRERPRVFAAVTPDVVSRLATVARELPADMRERAEPTQSDALRLVIARGLAWVEAHGVATDVPSKTPRAKRIGKWDGR